MSTDEREIRIQEWIDRPSMFEPTTHNDIRGRDGTAWYIRTPGGSLTYLWAPSGPADLRHAQPVRMATTTSAPFNVNRAFAVRLIRDARAAGQEVTCRRYFYRHQDGPYRSIHRHPSLIA